MRHPNSGGAKGFLTMYIRTKRNKSGTISVVVVDKSSGKYREIETIGIAKDEGQIEDLMARGRKWIAGYQERLHPTFDFDCRVEVSRERERQEVERVVSSIENVLLNGRQYRNECRQSPQYGQDCHNNRLPST